MNIGIVSLLFMSFLYFYYYFVRLYIDLSIGDETEVQPHLSDSVIAFAGVIYLESK